MTHKKAWSDTPTKKQWFSSQIGDYQYIDEKGLAPLHPFYDFTPIVDAESKTVSFFVVSPEKSKSVYDFDQLSGKRFIKHPLCPQEDVWTGDDSLYDAPYTEGIIPRTLNGLARPQRIWVFGGRDSYQSAHEEESFSARIVGGLIRQACLKTRCARGEGWESSLILLGVAEDDSRFDAVEDIEALKGKVDWGDVLLYAQNGDCARVIGSDAYPVFRISGEVHADYAYKSVFQERLMLQDKELALMQKGCVDLYDYAWNKMGVWKRKQQEIGVKQELLEAAMESHRLQGKSRKIELLSPKELVGAKNSAYAKNFYDEFRAFHYKFGEKYSTCIRFVKSLNGGPSPAKHWFLAYLEAFYSMVEIGYTYDCHLKDWKRVETKELARKGINLFFKECFLSEIEGAFERIIPTLEDLQNSAHRHYRFIEYDQGQFGTHNRLYNWVLDEGTKPNCDSSEEDKIDFSNQLKLYKKIFPGDVLWDSFKMKKAGVVF